MQTTHRLLERELAFTARYRASTGDKTARELAVLEYQLAHYFVLPHEGDLLAGRIDRPFVTFSPCLEGDEIDKVGYAIDEASCRRLLEQIKTDPTYDDAYAAAVEEMIRFWREENTNTKARARYAEDWAFAAPSDDYLRYRAALHPIYRLAGLHLDFKKLYRLGLCGLQEDLRAKATGEHAAFYLAAVEMLEYIKRVCRDYADEVQNMADTCADNERRTALQKMATALHHVAVAPPANFREALQLQVIYMLAGRFVEFGRVDDYMCDIYHQSIADGSVTREEAVCLLDNLFTIIHEEHGRDTRVIIGGVGRENPTAADAFADVVLDVLERRQFCFYPQFSLRCYQGMDERLYTRSLDLLGRGYPYPLLYNDDVNVPSVMRAMDVPRRVAEHYSFFGCGEFMLDRRSIGTPNSALNIAKVLELTLFNGYEPRTGERLGLQTGEFTSETTFDELVARFKQQMDFFCYAAGQIQDIIYKACAEQATFLQASILLDDCVARGKGFLDGGISHLGGTVETYGNVTAYDSLAAIRTAIYEEGYLTAEELLAALKTDFADNEVLRRRLRHAPKFGNDDPRADDLAAELHEHICQGIRSQKNATSMDSFLVVVINNSMNVTLGLHVGATPDGRHADTLLSNGNNPTNGCDTKGLTALIRSMTKMDTSIHACGNQNLKVSPAMFQHDAAGIKAVISAFFRLGGQQLNLSMVDQAALEDAMIHPEQHEDIIVRVGGFSARFVTLAPDVQQDILHRTAY